MTKLIVVLGMHRSGTSYAAQLLQRAGVYLGPDLMNDVAPDNLEGFGESRQAVRLNDRFLQLSDGDYMHPPDHLQSDADADAARDAFLADLRSHPVAGWKDPRTTLTWPLWKPHLGVDYTLIGCLRHPMNVARSLQVRQQLPLEQGLALWEAYNRRLWDYLQNETVLHLLDFDAAPAHLLAQSRTLCRKLALPDEEAAKVFNPYLRHHQQTDPLPPSPLRDLYEQLCDAARRQRDAASAPPPPAAAADDAAEGDLLRRAVHLQNLSLQEMNGRFHHTLLDVLARLSFVEEQTKARNLQVFALEERQKLQAFESDERRKAQDVRSAGVEGWIEHLRREAGAVRAQADGLQGWVDVLRRNLDEDREKTASALGWIEEKAASALGWTEALREQVGQSQSQLISLDGWINVLREQLGGCESRLAAETESWPKVLRAESAKMRSQIESLHQELEQTNVEVRRLAEELVDVKLAQRGVFHKVWEFLRDIFGKSPPAPPAAEKEAA
jgi:hypothetical protein